MRILEPISIGGVTFKNRIMFPPLTTGYEERDGEKDKLAKYFSEAPGEGG